MALPTKNLTFDAIRNVLNATGGSVTNEVATAFKSTSGINKFSRNKPESYKADFIEGGGSPKEKNNFGLRILGNYSSLSSLFEGQDNVWQYILPTGGVNSPYRLGDFCGYEMYGQPPLMSFIPASLRSNGLSGLNQNYKAAFVFLFNGSSYPNNYWTATGSIGIQELYTYPTKTYLSNTYPGVAVRWKETESGTYNYFWVTSSQKVSENLNAIPVILDIGETPFATKATVFVEVAFGFFSSKSGDEYDTGTHACHLSTDSVSNVASAETSLGANKGTFKITKEDAKLGMTYKITATYTINGSTLKVTSFKVDITIKDKYNRPPTLSFRPFGIVAHGSSGVAITKWLSTGGSSLLNVQSVSHDYWINNTSKTLTWSSSDLNNATFSGLSSPIRALSVQLAAGGSADLESSTTMSDNYLAHSVTVNSPTTSGTVTG